MVQQKNKELLDFSAPTYQDQIKECLGIQGLEDPTSIGSQMEDEEASFMEKWTSCQTVDMRNAQRQISGQDKS